MTKVPEEVVAAMPVTKWSEGPTPGPMKPVTRTLRRELRHQRSGARGCLGDVGLPARTASNRESGREEDRGLRRRIQHVLRQRHDTLRADFRGLLQSGRPDPDPVHLFPITGRSYKGGPVMPGREQLAIRHHGRISLEALALGELHSPNQRSTCSRVRAGARRTGAFTRATWRRPPSRRPSAST